METIMPLAPSINKGAGKLEIDLFIASFYCLALATPTSAGLINLSEIEYPD
jgi:hypothetical protein